MEKLLGTRDRDPTKPGSVDATCTASSVAMLGGVCVRLTCKGRARDLNAEVAKVAYKKVLKERIRPGGQYITFEDFLEAGALPFLEPGLVVESILADLEERVSRQAEGVSSVSSAERFLPIFTLV